MYKSVALRTLGFNKNQKPTDKEVKRAYRRIARECHPDKLIIPENFTVEERTSYINEHSERFDKATNAQDCLLNPEKLTPESEEVDFLNRDFDEAMTGFFGNRHVPKGGVVHGNVDGKYSLYFSFHIERNRPGGTTVSAEFTHNQYFNFNTSTEFEEFCELLTCKKFKQVFLYSENHPLPSFAKKMVGEALLQNTHTFESHHEEGLLSEEHEKQLKALFHERNYPNRLKKVQDKVKEDHESRYTKYSSLFSFIFLSKSLFLTFVGLVLGVLYGDRLGTLRYNYIDIAANRFRTEEDKITFSTEAEKHSAQCGLDAITWKGYFQSYKRLCTYKHPRVFAGALKVALDEDEKALPKLRTAVK